MTYLKETLGAKRPTFKNEAPGNFALNVDNWIKKSLGKKPKSIEEITRDIQAFLREAQEGSVEQRINLILTPLDKFSRLVKPVPEFSTDVATAEIYRQMKQLPPEIEIQTPNPTYINVLTALREKAPLQLRSASVWISAAGEAYEQARTYPYFLISVNGEPTLLTISICGQYTNRECLENANRLGQYTTRGHEELLRIDNIEELRQKPIPVRAPLNESPEDFWERVMPLDGIWRQIIQGEILRGIIDEYVIIKGMARSKYLEIMAANDSYSQWLVGSQLELLLEQQFKIALSSTGHDRLYSHVAIPGKSIGHVPGLPRIGETLGQRVHCGECEKYNDGDPISFSCPKSKLKLFAN